MILLYDCGAWTYVDAQGPTARAEYLEIESLLVMPVPEGAAHVWAGYDGLVHFLRPGSAQYARFPRGFAPDLIVRLRARGIEVAHRPDARWPRDFDNTGWETFYGRLLNDAQRWAASEMWRHRDGICSLFTRFGKSYVTATAWVAAGRPWAAIVVPRADIIRQGVAELSAWLGEPVGWVCSDVGPPNLQRLTFVSLPSVMERKTGAPRPEYAAWLAALEAVYVDECHLAGDSMWAFHEATANRIIQWGISATPFVSDALKDTGLIGWSGPIRLEMKARQGADLGMISSMVVRWVDVTCSPSLCVNASIAAGAAGLSTYIDHMLVNNGPYNRAIAQLALHHLAHGDPVVIFVDRVKHGLEIAKLIPGCAANVGTVTPSKKRAFQADFNAGTLRCVVVTKRWREGITLHTNVVINAEGLKADHLQEQRAGRGLMPKVDGRPLVLYEFAFNDPPRYTLARWSTARAKFYKKAGWPQENSGTVDVPTLA